MSKKTPKTNEPEHKKTKYDLKMEARRKAEKKDKITSTIFRTVCITLLAAIVLTAGYFSVSMIVDIVNANNKPYVTVGDHSLSQVEYDYYFNSTVSNYLNTYSSFLSYMGLDTSVPYDEQQYSEDMTWQEYFEQSTVEQMKREFALLDDAAKNGFEYDTTDDYNSFLEQAKSAADTDKVSLQAYYKTMFGQYATAKNVKDYIRNTYIANAYYQKLLEDNKPSDDEVTSHYNDNKADYDQFAYYSFSFASSDYEDSSESIEAMAEEMKEKAAAGKDFETLCKEYAPDSKKDTYGAEDGSEASLTQGVTGSTQNSDFRSWLTDESRKAGDTVVIKNNDGSTYYVLKFVSRTYDDSCKDTISSSLASDVVSEYINGLTEAYTVTDLSGSIGYLNTEADTTDASSDSTEDASTDSSSEQ